MMHIRSDCPICGYENLIPCNEAEWDCEQCDYNYDTPFEDEAEDE